MTLVERYIFRIAFSAFLACLVGLTVVIWITQALRELDLITGKGQTFFVFLMVTGLSLPALVTVIAPVALFIAVIYALNRLNGDSELIVMSAAGMHPLRLMRPFATLSALVCTLVAVTTLYLMPASFQELRDLITRIRADFVANLVKEGQFTTLDAGVTFHYRERQGDALMGIFMQDKREPDRVIVYLAERGRTVDVEGQSFLVLDNGSIHRQQPGSRDSSIVAFDRYALNLSALTPDNADVVYKPRERSTTALMFPDKSEFYYQFQEGRFRAELHDRLSSWLYPLAMMLIAFAALGDPRTTRQGRGAAVLGAVIAVVLLRVAGFAASSALVRTPAAVILVYGAPLLAIVLSLLILFQGPRMKVLESRIARAMASIRMPRLSSARRA
jgi:lipopolysaccharide export system permease protein